MSDDRLAKLAAIGRMIRDQDNRCTDAPLFIVQQKKRVYGFDSAFTDGDGVAWIDIANDFDEADREEHARLEAEWKDTRDEPEGWQRTVYHDDWVFVTACFTEQGCKDYIRRNGHNLREPRIYADGSYRNEEFRTVREILMSLAKEPIDVTSRVRDALRNVRNELAGMNPMTAACQAVSVVNAAIKQLENSE